MPASTTMMVTLVTVRTVLLMKARSSMKLRVAMSVISLNYTASFPPGSESVWRPVGDAFGGFVASFAGAFAGIIRFVAEILPVLIIGGLLVFGVVSLLRWRGKRGKKPVAPPSSTVKPQSGV